MTSTPITTGFGSLAQAIRVKHSKRIVDQSEALGVSASYISKIETGQVAPDLKYVEKFSQWLKIDIQEQISLIKSLRLASVVDLNTERRRRKGPELKLFRRVRSMSPGEIRAIASDDGSNQ